MASFFETFIEDYVWYHAITLTVVLVFAVLLLVHRVGSEQNMKIMLAAKIELDPLLMKAFSEYDGEVLVESPNIIKLYPSGRETCLFAIVAFAVKN